ncbi:GNAT family N-acetyltransferase [Natrarchaeobaculum sulfurireducens]|uniref:GNAT family N-acetyltransferase n=1 Tax=Natrarchaeobaculum sulfurireducens TaxID=2044521 RepID=UPI00137ADEB3|nr:GNAT family N-acetyltransferase [Natrarchaeobaculum sulfurireducens]
MSLDLQIRRAVADDATDIARCYRRAYATATERGYRTRLTDVDAETVADWLEADGATLVAVEAGVGPEAESVVGTIRLLEDATPTVERLAVVPERRQEGIAAQLLERAERLASDRGEHRLRLATFDEHPFLLEWYARRGYRTVDCPDKPAVAYGIVLLEKCLGPAQA